MDSQSDFDSSGKYLNPFNLLITPQNPNTSNWLKSEIPEIHHEIEHGRDEQETKYCIIIGIASQGTDFRRDRRTKNNETAVNCVKSWNF